ncbi:MAG TPA: class GN sortase [Casimicrobiaceae bacterium]|nr:class GN sortase [Casimicrobiaceae bacterium]
MTVSTRNIVIAGALFSVAAWLAGEALYLHAKALVGQRLLVAAWHQAQRDGTRAQPWPWADTHPVARLSVPALGIDQIILAGANGRTLAWGPGHVESTAKPGLSGNAVVTAHRDTHFGFLPRLAIGEIVVVETASRTKRRYRVERRFVADHRALRLPADEDVTTLSLVTCYPFDAIDPDTPLRYAVIARAVD